MKHRPQLYVALLALAMVLAIPALAHASASEVIRDCALDSKLDKHYSQADLAAARKQLPTDVDEYTDCRDVIARAQLGGGSGGGGRGSASGTGAGVPTGANGGSTAADVLAAASPQERAAVQKAVSGGATPVQIGNRTLSPASLGVGDLAKSHSLPGALIVVLILLAVSSAGGLALVRSRR